ncbi:hypothetical protein BOTCAL_0206g00040 [Botryotinia calthae]|uniref:F-box domain-containing protein n=1 Tax=Botryotinia calthae TaxID=38488 RepID=A0A4Y8D1H5_9HELO|nr:hypothetical protein BOTCAL_0206g00040 [Botryotinia calthae]
MAYINPPPTLSSHLLSLPVELTIFVILYMDFPAIKSTRLTCKWLSFLSTPYLILPKFHGFAHRPDFNRLLQLCRHPTFSSCIQSIELNLGDIDEVHARHNAYLFNSEPYISKPGTRAELAEEAWFRYSSLKFLKEENSSLICDPDILSEVFRSLPNLSALSVSMVNFPLPDEPALSLLASVWRVPSTRLLHRDLTKKRFTTILFSLLHSVDVLKLRKLSHDCLPFEFFSQNKVLFESITPIFSNLTDLRLALDYSNIPDNLDPKEAFANIAICLKAATNLENFYGCFQSKRKIDITPLLEDLLSKSDEQKHFLPRLRSLHIEGVSSRFHALESFLISLSSTLEVIEFGGDGCHEPNQLSNGGVHLLDGKFRRLFENVERAIGDPLTRFVVRGDLVEVEGGGSWFLNREVGWHGAMD